LDKQGLRIRRRRGTAEEEEEEDQVMTFSRFRNW